MIDKINEAMADAFLRLAKKTLDVTEGVVNAVSGLGYYYTAMGLNPNVQGGRERAMAGASAAASLLMTPEGAVGARIGIQEGRNALRTLMAGEYKGIAGVGLGSPFRAAASLGGNASDWQYVVSKGIIEANGFKWQARWAVNIATGETAMPKLKAVGFVK